MRIGTAILALLILFSFSARRGAAEEHLTVTSHGDRLTIQARDAGLNDVFGRLGEAAGVSVHLRGRGDRRVTVELEAVEIEEAVGELLKPYSSAIVFKRDRDERITSIDVYLSESAATRSPEPRFRISAEASAETEVEQHFAVEIAKIDRVTDLLREGKKRPQSLLSDPSPSVRITALQSFSEKNDLVEALDDALADSDDLVQAAARQMLLDRGTPDDLIDTLASLERSGKRVEARLRLANLAERW